jgi:hypothetical protein
MKERNIQMIISASGSTKRKTKEIKARKNVTATNKKGVRGKGGGRFQI